MANEEASYLDWQNKTKKNKPISVDNNDFSEIFKNKIVQDKIKKIARIQNFMENKSLKKIYVVQEKKKYAFEDKYGFFSEKEADDFIAEMDKDFSEKSFRRKPNHITLVSNSEK